MALPFSILLVGLGLGYATLMGMLVLGFRRVQQRPVAPPEPAEWPLVSVVIPARNEATSIAACLDSVLTNDYPVERFEVIVVDDGSTDGMSAVVRRLQRQYNHAPVAAGSPSSSPPERLRLLRLQSDGDGHKHAALAHGIAEARGTIICTTDADCTVRPGWLRAMTGTLTPEVAFVAGPVRYRTGASLFGKLQALEFLGLQAFGAGSLGIGRPTICNSANVAYRRDVHQNHAPPAAAGAAADELLLQHLTYETDWRVRFCASPDAIVEATPSSTLHAFLAQRRRWASMGTRYPSAALVAAVALLYGFYVLLLVSLGAVWFTPALTGPLLVALALKIGGEALLLHPACRFFEQKTLFRYFPWVELLHLPYVVYVGAAGAFGTVRWKDRTLD